MSELREECIEKGQNFIQVSSDIYSKIELGGTFNSAWVAIRDLLYQYTQYNESISIQAIPIYHLDVKPENIIYESNDIHSPMKLTDFGCSLLADHYNKETK